MSRRPGGAPARQGGIALMLVLWVITLLIIMAVGLTADQRTESSLAANQVGGARFRALSDAAIAYAVYQLAAPINLVAEQAAAAAEAETEAWIPDGAPRPWRFAGEDLSITVIDEQSLIDLNQASRELLTGLLTALDLPTEEVDALADAVLDWRDPDDLHQLKGAEDPDYAAAGRAYGAKDGPFDSVEELQQVLGFDRALYLALAPVLTVSGMPTPASPELAPPLVQAAMEGASLDDVQRRREQQAAATPIGGAPPAVNRGGPLYRLRVSLAGEAAAEDGAPAMEALVRVEPGGAPPYRVLWRNFAPLWKPQPIDEDVTKK